MLKNTIQTPVYKYKTEGAYSYYIQSLYVKNISDIKTNERVFEIHE